MSRKITRLSPTNILLSFLLSLLCLPAFGQRDFWLSVGYEAKLPDLAGLNEIVSGFNQSQAISESMPAFGYLQGIAGALGLKEQNNFLELSFYRLQQTREASSLNFVENGLRFLQEGGNVKLGYANSEARQMYAFGGIIQQDRFTASAYQTIESEESSDDPDWRVLTNQVFWSAGVFIRIQLRSLAFEPYYLWPLGKTEMPWQPVAEELTPLQSTEAAFRPGGFGFRVSLLLGGE